MYRSLYSSWKPKKIFFRNDNNLSNSKINNKDVITELTATF